MIIAGVCGQCGKYFSGSGCPTCLKPVKEPTPIVKLKGEGWGKEKPKPLYRLMN